MRYILFTILLFCLTGCNNVGTKPELTVDQKIDNEKEAIEVEQTEHIKTSSEYLQVMPYIKDGVKYRVHKYKTNNDEYGYQVIIEYDDYIKSIGYGVHAERKTYIKKKLPEDL